MKKDEKILRDLAKRWMELASLPVMEERKRQWKALKDLKAERPMILLESEEVIPRMLDTMLECEDPLFRGVEKQMKTVLMHAEEVGDDYVVEPVLNIEYYVASSDYGVQLESIRVQDDQSSLAYQFNTPVKTPEDVKKLKPRTFSIDIESNIKRKEIIENVLGDILPVELHYSGPMGYMHVGLTSPLYSLIGMENMMLWMYDAPDAFCEIMDYLANDRIAHGRFLEEQGILSLNNGNQYSGSGSLGYTNRLPSPGFDGKVRVKDMWCFAESQETLYVSPDKFKEFVLPYMAKVCSEYGLVYYGCCEPLQDRWDYIAEAIPNIGAVSISPWSDQEVMAEKLGRDYVFSRKPMPSYISGEQPDWDLLKKDVESTLKAAKDCNLEIVFRDIYDVNGDISRFAKWTDMVRSMI